MTISFSNGSIMTLYAGRKMNWLYLSSLSFQPSLSLYHQTIVLFLSSQLLSVSLDKHIFCRSPTPTLRLLGQPTLLQIASMNRIQVGLREYKTQKYFMCQSRKAQGIVGLNIGLPCMSTLWSEVVRDGHSSRQNRNFSPSRFGIEARQAERKKSIWVS